MLIAAYPVVHILWHYHRPMLFLYMLWFHELTYFYQILLYLEQRLGCLTAILWHNSFKDKKKCPVYFQIFWAVPSSRKLKLCMQNGTWSWIYLIRWWNGDVSTTEWKKEGQNHSPLNFFRIVERYDRFGYWGDVCKMGLGFGFIWSDGRIPMFFMTKFKRKVKNKDPRIFSEFLRGTVISQIEFMYAKWDLELSLSDQMVEWRWFHDVIQKKGRKQNSLNFFRICERYYHLANWGWV